MSSVQRTVFAHTRLMWPSPREHARMRRKGPGCGGAGLIKADTFASQSDQVGCRFAFVAMEAKTIRATVSITSNRTFGTPGFAGGNAEIAQRSSKAAILPCHPASRAVVRSNKGRLVTTQTPNRLECLRIHSDVHTDKPAARARHAVAYSPGIVKNRAREARKQRKRRLDRHASRGQTLPSSPKMTPQVRKMVKLAMGIIHGKCRLICKALSEDQPAKWFRVNRGEFEQAGDQAEPDCKHERGTWRAGVVIEYPLPHDLDSLSHNQTSRPLGPSQGRHFAILLTACEASNRRLTGHGYVSETPSESRRTLSRVHLPDTPETLHLGRPLP